MRLLSGLPNRMPQEQALEEYRLVTLPVYEEKTWGLVSIVASQISDVMSSRSLWSARPCFALSP